MGLAELAAELKERVDTYANACVDGQIVCGQKHEWACLRYLRDHDNEDYYFDTLELARLKLWASQFTHRVGILAGKPIELTDYQLFKLGSLFAWKRVADNRRRFKKGYIQVGRKNAKSQDLAIMGSYECFTNKEQSEVYLAGWDRNGSNIVYREIKHQLGSSQFLKGKYKEAYGQFTFLKDGSFIKPLSKEAKNSDSANNPSFAIVDEYKEHKTSEIYDNLWTGMMGRPEPLICIITTPGEDLAVPCHKEYQYVCEILDPDNKINNDEYFVDICELDDGDDPADESVWIKANPILATYDEGLNNLRTALTDAVNAPEKMRSFLTKNMGIWVQMKADGYMDMAKWRDCEADFDFDVFREPIVGADLSTKVDLTSVFFEEHINGKYYCVHHSFITEVIYEQYVREARYPWAQWEKEGWLTVIPGAVIDREHVKAYIKEKEEQFGFDVSEIAYDPFSASQFALDMSNDGYACTEIRQGMRTLNEPTDDFRGAVYRGDVVHQPDGLLEFAVGNAVIFKDGNNNIRLDKKRSKEKIDPIAAGINAHCRCMVAAKEIDANTTVDLFLEMFGE